jgi:hypothetical protein
LSVNLDEPDYGQRCALVRHHDVTVAWIVRQAVHTMNRQQQDATATQELPILRDGPYRARSVS